MVIDGQIFCGMLISAANALDNNKTIINNMNVFPVPDGDTGINMTLTMSAIKTLSRSDGSLSDVAEKGANIVLRAARGNSGAILSLFFRGMAKSFRGLDAAGSTELARAFRRGSDEAYKAVMNPTEGTILTIMRTCAEKAEKGAAGKYADDVVGLFAYIGRKAEEALAKTPEQLPVLKEVNLVDAGGYGFVVILNGMLAALRHHPVEALSADEDEEESVERTFAEVSTADIRFGYCTECIVEKDTVHRGEGSADSFKHFVSELGDSMVFVDDEEIIKLHIHTNHPGRVLEAALEYGSLMTVKIENMRNQHSEILGVSTSTAEEEPVLYRAIPEKKYGFVSVCMGDGIRDTFCDLGVDQIIFGGQTMNPSTQDIIDGVNRTPAEIVFVLPNNKNIYMVAQQAATIIEDKKVIVLATKNVPQGISAMLAIDPDAELDVNMESMNAAIDAVKALSVTHAVRDTTLNDVKIADGQYLGMVDGKIDTVCDSLDDCMKQLSAQAEGSSFITIFYGEETTEEAALTVAEYFKEKAGVMADVNVICGGQPLYPYLVSIE